MKKDEEGWGSEEWRMKNKAIESVSQEGAMKLILITSTPDTWMIEWSNDWMIEWSNDWMIEWLLLAFLEANTIISFRVY
jgi:hypothetical protein